MNNTSSLLDTPFLLSSEIFERAADFAAQQYETSKDAYARRGQSNAAKIKRQTGVGKLGEEVAYGKISPFYPSIQKPDYTIYTASKKSWDDDLLNVEGQPSFAVKSQDTASAGKYALSWVAQYRVGASYDVDRGIFMNEGEDKFFVFTLIDVANKIGMIKAIIRLSFLHKNNLFEEMKVFHLRGNKKAIYFSSLEEKCGKAGLCQI